MGGKLSKKKKGYDVSDPKDLKDEITATAVGAVEAVQAAVENALPAEAAGMTAEAGKKASAAVEEVVGSTMDQITQAVGGVMGMGETKEEAKDEPAPPQKDPEEPAAKESAAVEPTPVPKISVEEPAPVEKEPEPAAEEQVAIKPATVKTPTAEEVAVEPVAVEPAAVEPVAVEPAAVEPVAVEPAAVEPVAVETAPVEPVAVEPTPVPEIILEVSSPVQKDPEPAAEEQEPIKHVAVETPTADEVAEVEPVVVEPELTPLHEIPAPVENDPEPAIVDAAAVEAQTAVEQVAIEPVVEVPAVDEPATVQNNQELTPEEAPEVAEGGTLDNAPAQIVEASVVSEAPMVEPSALSPMEISPVEQPEPKPAESLEDDQPVPEPHLEKPEAYTEISEAPSATFETAPESVTEPDVAVEESASELQSKPSTDAVEEQGIAEVKQEAAAPEVCSSQPEPVTEETLTEVSPEPEAPEAITEVVGVSVVPVDEAIPEVETKMENGDTNSQSAGEEEEEEKEKLDLLPVVNGGCSDSSDLSEEQVNGNETEPQLKAASEQVEVTKDLTLNAVDDMSEMVKSLSAADNQAVELV